MYIFYVIDRFKVKVVSRTVVNDLNPEVTVQRVWLPCLNSDRGYMYMYHTSGVSNWGCAYRP